MPDCDFLVLILDFLFSITRTRTRTRRIGAAKSFRAREVCYTLRAMPVQPDPDAAMMLRVKRGDRAAFAELVDKYKQPVLNFIYRTLRDEIEAEDLAQTVFLQVYRSRSRYRQTAKFSTWLFTIARNLCLNELRRRSRHPAESIE